MLNWSRVPLEQHPTSPSQFWSRMSDINRFGHFDPIGNGPIRRNVESNAVIDIKRLIWSVPIANTKTRSEYRPSLIQRLRCSSNFEFCPFLQKHKHDRHFLKKQPPVMKWEIQHERERNGVFPERNDWNRFAPKFLLQIKWCWNGFGWIDTWFYALKLVKIKKGLKA